MDEWLARGPCAAGARRGPTAAVTNETVASPTPAAEAVQSEEKAKVAAINPHDVALADGDVHEWFWRLLELGGHERW